MSSVTFIRLLRIQIMP